VHTSKGNGGLFLPKVQVVMPSFNRPNIVQQAIKSVQNQTLKDFRLYIMDNSSEQHWDRMNKVYMEFAKDDSRIVIDHTEAVDSLRLKHHYVCIVTNKALFELHQHEPYVVMTCDDIVMLPQKLEILSSFLDKHGEYDIASGILEITDDRGKAIQRLGGFSLSCAANMLDWCQPMYRRTLIEVVGKLAEHTVANADADYFERIAKVTEKVFGIPVVLDHANVRFRGTRGSKQLLDRMLKGELME